MTTEFRLVRLKIAVLISDGPGGSWFIGVRYIKFSFIHGYLVANKNMTGIAAASPFIEAS